MSHGLTPILLVDDRPQNLKALEALLGDLDLHLCLAHSGQEALRQSLRTEFALVLLDVQMPDMDGFETAELLRANPRTRHLPIIFVTAGGKDIQHRFRGYEAGAVDYLMKPIEPLELRSKVRVFSDLYQQRKEIERHEALLDLLVQQRTTALQEREASYRTILENASDFVMRFDLQGAYLFANARTQALWGLGPDALLGRTHRDLGCPEELCQQLEAALARVFTEGCPGTLTFWLESALGRLYLELKLTPELDALGHVQSVVGMARDLTERHSLEEVRQFLSQASWTREGPPFFPSLARYLASCLDVEYVCIDRLEGDQKHAQTLAIFADGEPQPNERYALADTPCGVVVDRKVCCFPQGVRPHFPKDQALQDLLAESYVGTVLWSSLGEPIGLMAAISRRPLRNPPLAIKTLELAAIRAAGELERSQADEALRRLSELLEVSGSLARVGGWEVDLGTGQLHWTPETYRIHGVSPEDFTPTVEDALGFYAPESKPLITRAVQEAISLGKEFDLELEIITATGRRVQVQATGRSQVEEGKVLRLLGAFRDITREKRAEAERRQLEREIQHAQKLESLGNLAGGVAHDMNNVLAAIMGIASTLKSVYGADPALSKSLGTILDASLRGRDLVKGLTNFARKEVASTQHLDLNALVQKEVELLRRTTLEKITFELSLEASLPVLQGESSSLSNALMNLCMNAFDAMPEGGHVHITTRTLEAGWVELSVQDSGEGMTPEVLARATDPFFTTKAFGKGTGLGLSIVYGTVKAHGGRLSLESTPGEGTRVSLAFPVQEAHPPADLAPPPGQESQPLHPHRILLVDDDALIRQAIPSMLEALGHRVEVAASGVEALAKLKVPPSPFDLVIMDHNMVGLTGAATLRKVRSTFPGLPLMISTGHADAEVKALCRDFPDIRLLMKPYSLQDLATALKAMVPPQTQPALWGLFPFETVYSP